MAVAVVVEESASSAPSNFFVVESYLFSDVGESAVAIVAEENVVSPEAAEEIVKAVVIVIADADAGLPAGAGEAGFFGDVGECAIAIIFVKMGSGSLTGGPLFGEVRAGGEGGVGPAGVIAVEENEARALGF